MKNTSRKYGLLVLIVLLCLWVTADVGFGTPPPQTECVPECGGCQTCRGGVCENDCDASECMVCRNGDSCVEYCQEETECGKCSAVIGCDPDESRCSGCCTCSDSQYSYLECVDNTGECTGECQICVDCSCTDYDFLCEIYESCCGGSCCGNACCNDTCCESPDDFCCGGECCDGDKTCCDGECTEECQIVDGDSCDGGTVGECFGCELFGSCGGDVTHYYGGKEKICNPRGCSCTDGTKVCYTTTQCYSLGTFMAFAGCGGAGPGPVGCVAVTVPTFCFYCSEVANSTENHYVDDDTCD